jgi:hypothetical protein
LISHETMMNPADTGLLAGMNAVIFRAVCTNY